MSDRMGGGIDRLLGMLGGGQGGAQGLGGLVDRLRQAGLGDEVDSWVGTGANKPVAPERLETALGSGTLAGLAQRFGGAGGMAGAGGIAGVLAMLLPQLINALTPQGRVPQRDEEFGQGGMGGLLAQVMGGGASAQGGGLGTMLGGLLGGGQQGARGTGQAGGGPGGMLDALMGGGAQGPGSAPAGKPGLDGDGGAPLPQKPRPAG